MADEQKSFKVSESENIIESLSAKLIVNLAKTSSLIEEIFERFYKEYNLSKPQFNALYAIYASGDKGITLSELGDIMVVTRANITTLIDRMEARGLVKREFNKEDRRSIKAVITKEGREIISKIVPSHRIFSSEILNFLNEKEKERVNELLERIQKELAENYLKD